MIPKYCCVCGKKFLSYRSQNRKVCSIICENIRRTKKKCKNGHDLSFHRRRTKLGNVYCKKCIEDRQKTIVGRRLAKNRTRKYRYTQYGTTEEKVLKLLIEQNYKCAISETPITIDKLHIDHCHTTGKIRGLLCSLCNMGLGLFKDNPKRMRKGAEYVERQNRPEVELPETTAEEVSAETH